MCAEDVNKHKYDQLVHADLWYIIFGITTHFKVAGKARIELTTNLSYVTY